VLVIETPNPMENIPKYTLSSLVCPNCASLSDVPRLSAFVLKLHPAIYLIYGKHPDDRELAYSVSRRGIVEPLHVLSDGTVLCGRRRLQAAQHVGLRKVPVLIVDCMSPIAEVEYILDSNETKHLFDFQRDRVAEARLEICRYKEAQGNYDSRIINALLRHKEGRLQGLREDQH
jgi:hypothetical protein